MEASEEPDDDEPIPPAYVTLSTGIDQASTRSLLTCMADFASATDVDEVRLLISTPGGNVANGINLYNVLRGMSFKLVTHNVGTVHSIGVPIFLAGDERLACPNSTFLIHNVTTEFLPGQAMTAEALAGRRENILEDQARIDAILAERTTLTEDRLGDFGDDVTISAEQAIEYGIATGIADVDIEPDAVMLTA